MAYNILNVSRKAYALILYSIVVLPTQKVSKTAYKTADVSRKASNINLYSIAADPSQNVSKTACKNCECLRQTYSLRTRHLYSIVVVIVALIDRSVFGLYSFDFTVLPESSVCGCGMQLTKGR